MELARSAIVPRTVPVSAVGRGPAVVAGTVRRLVFLPDGGEGSLLATLDDGTGDLDVRLPRALAGDWAPGATVAAEGAMQTSGFVVRAYLPSPDEDPARTWVEVAPLPGSAR